MAKFCKPKIRILSVRLTEEEHAKIVARATLEGLAPSQFARAKALNDGEVPPQVFSELPEIGAASPGDTLIAEQIRRLGVNLNQIAYQLNMLNVPVPAELDALLNEINRYMQLVWAREGL